MGAVSLTKCQWGCQLYGTIGFSYKRVLHNTLDPRNPLIRLEKTNKFDLPTIRTALN